MPSGLDLLDKKAESPLENLDRPQGSPLNALDQVPAQPTPQTNPWAPQMVPQQPAQPTEAPQEPAPQTNPWAPQAAPAQPTSQQPEVPAEQPAQGQGVPEIVETKPAEEEPAIMEDPLKDAFNKAFQQEEPVVATILDKINLTDKQNPVLARGFEQEDYLADQSIQDTQGRSYYIRHNKALEIENKLLRGEADDLRGIVKELASSIDLVNGEYKTITKNLTAALNPNNKGIRREQLDFDRVKQEEIKKELYQLRNKMTDQDNKHKEQELNAYVTAAFARMGLNNDQVKFVGSIINKDNDKWYAIVQQGYDFLETAIQTELKKYKEQEQAVTLTKKQMMDMFQDVIKKQATTRQEAKPSVREEAPAQPAPQPQPQYQPVPQQPQGYYAPQQAYQGQGVPQQMPQQPVQQPAPQPVSQVVNAVPQGYAPMASAPSVSSFNPDGSRKKFDDFYRQIGKIR